MKLFSWGANSYGQLGHGIQSEQYISPTEAILTNQFEDIVAVAAGGGHTLVLNSMGFLLGTGSNNNGQLADCQKNTTVLMKIEAIQECKVAHIECGWESSYAVTDTGSIIVWGSNKYGQLGISKEKVKTTSHPMVLETPHVIQVSAGLRHTAMLSSDGHVFVCGQANKGQLGVLSSDGNVPKQDFDSLVKVNGVENVQQVACGQHHTLALTSDGCLYGWGGNRWGQLGEGPACFPTPQLVMTVDPHSTIRAGWTHSAVLSNGRVRTWGRHSYCQLGHSCGQQSAKPSDVPGLEGVKDLELGSEHNVALLDNGEVWSWGWNEHGNCGTGTVDNISTPQRVSIPASVSCIATGGGHSLALSLP